MIQDLPICFDCQTRVNSLADAVFAPPWHDDPTFPSAAFHPLCLMRWRDRRHVARDAMLATLRLHFTGECECDLHEPDEERE